jgi:hypothetical protein
MTKPGVLPLLPLQRLHNWGKQRRKRDKRRRRQGRRLHN